MVQFGQAHVQQRIREFCQLSNRECVVQFEPCVIGRVKPIFYIPGADRMSVPYAISADVLAGWQDDELWQWLGVVTGGRIVRPPIINRE